MTDMDKIVTAQPVRATRLRYGSSNQANNAPDLAHALSWHPKKKSRLKAGVRSGLT